jgi:hypothetical protein
MGIGLSLDAYKIGNQGRVEAWSSLHFGIDVTVVADCGEGELQRVIALIPSLLTFT